MIVVALIVLFVLIILFCARQEPYVSQIPKIIWTYWDGDEIPQVVHKCIQTWRKFNPNYRIHVVTRNKIPEYLPNDDILSMRFTQTPQQVSDLVRVHLLAKYGGVWSDASNVMNKPLDTLLREHEGYDFIGYTLHGEKLHLENWFFMCTQDNTFVQLWKDEMKRIQTFKTLDDYFADVKQKNVNTSKISDPHYLWMHVAAQVVLQTQVSPDYMKKHMKILDASSGPFKFMTDNQWESEVAVNSLCDVKDKPVFFKLRGLERNLLENADDIQACLFKDV